jgi:hypothetical protein
MINRFNNKSQRENERREKGEKEKKHIRQGEDVNTTKLGV